MKGSLICFLDEDERFMEYGQTQRRILPKMADPFLDIYFFFILKADWRPCVYNTPTLLLFRGGTHSHSNGDSRFYLLQCECGAVAALLATGERLVVDLRCVRIRRVCKWG